MESQRKALYKGYLSEILTVSEDNTERLVERIVQEQLSFRILCDLRNKNESWYRIIEAVCVMELSQEEAADQSIEGELGNTCMTYQIENGYAHQQSSYAGIDHSNKGLFTAVQISIQGE